MRPSSFFVARYHMPNVWYAKCHIKAIVKVPKSPYLCSVINPHKFLDEPSGKAERGGWGSEQAQTQKR